jgi:hypothetical protein
MLRLGPAVVTGIGWIVTMPIVADALRREQTSWANIPFVVVALVTAGLWWIHKREREPRIGLAGAMAGWLFIGTVALFGVSGFLWLLVAMALLASAIAYGIVLLVTQSRAATPRLDLATGLVLFATGGATTMFAVTTGLSQIDAWWTPAHWILAIGVGIATILSGLPSGEVRGGASPVASGQA